MHPRSDQNTKNQNRAKFLRACERILQNQHATTYIITCIHGFEHHPSSNLKLIKHKVEVLRTCEKLIKQFERINHKQFEVKWRHSQGLGLVENYDYHPFRKSLVLQTSNSGKPSRFTIISLARLTKLLLV